MRQIIFFFIRNKNFLLFFLLFFVSIFATIRTHSFHNSKFVSSANFITGSIYSWKSEITNYLGLETENQKLVNENLRLLKIIEGYNDALEIPMLDSVVFSSKFKFFAANVINNNYSKSKNYITLNRGAVDSLRIDMGVISSKGLVGIISGVSENYATVQSILNTKSQINAKLKKTEHFGSLVWDTKDPNRVQLIDVPRIAPVAIGDTIVTGGRSTIFPKGILIGVIKDFKLEIDDNYYELNIELFNDMTNLGNVYIIENVDVEEIIQLEKEQEDVE